MKYCIFLMLFVCFSCDPIDDRFVINNLKGKCLYIQISYYDNETLSGYVMGKSLLKIDKGNNNIAVIGHWKSYSHDNTHMLMKICNEKDFEQLDSIYNINYGKGNYFDFQILDTLSKQNLVEEKKIIFKDLIKNDWKYILK